MRISSLRSDIQEEVMRLAASIGHSGYLLSLPFETRALLSEDIAEQLMNERVKLYRLREENKRLEAARAEQWRLRREAEASRDLEKSLSASFIAERDELLEVMKGIEHFSDALSFREDRLSKALRQWIDAGRSIIKREIGE
jgi:hypothetical protein